MRKQIVPATHIAQSLHFLRAQRVLFDYDLAGLYEIETRALKQAVRRNRNRFPADFMFELSPKGVATMVSQSVIPSGSKFGGASPMAFTEQGVATLSSVLRSEGVGERTRLACWRWRPRHRELFLRSVWSGATRGFSARRRNEHAGRVRSSIREGP